MPAQWHVGLVSAKFGGQPSAISITVVHSVRGRVPRHSKVALAPMEGCNHWVEGGQPRGLIPPWRSRMDHDPCAQRRLEPFPNRGTRSRAKRLAFSTSTTPTPLKCPGRALVAVDQDIELIQHMRGGTALLALLQRLFLGFLLFWPSRGGNHGASWSDAEGILRQNCPSREIGLDRTGVLNCSPHGIANVDPHAARLP